MLLWNDGQRGIVCRYADKVALEAQAMATGTCGTRFVPCGPASACAGLDGGCGGDLVCAKVSDADDERCSLPCTSDADCLPTDVLACCGGFCRIARTW